MRMQQPTKLNLGCGLNKIDGYVNIDKYAYGQPDLQWDLEVTPWPFPDNSVDAVLLNHTLEHLGAQVDTFFSIIRELYRVCMHGARLDITVPHPRHRNFLNDPTHVRIITPELMGLFSKQNCLQWQTMNAANSPLALYLDVDFEVLSSTVTVEAPYLQKMHAGELTQEQLMEMIALYNNVALEYRMVLHVVKTQ